RTTTRWSTTPERGSSTRSTISSRRCSPGWPPPRTTSTPGPRRPTTTAATSSAPRPSSTRPDEYRRVGPVLGPGLRGGGGRARGGRLDQGRVLGPEPGHDHGRARGPVHLAGRGVPGRGPDRGLHRRRDDAVPVR